MARQKETRREHIEKPGSRERAGFLQVISLDGFADPPELSKSRSF